MRRAVPLLLAAVLLVAAVAAQLAERQPVYLMFVVYRLSKNAIAAPAR